MHTYKHVQEISLCWVCIDSYTKAECVTTKRSWAIILLKAWKVLYAFSIIRFSGLLSSNINEIIFKIMMMHCHRNKTTDRIILTSTVAMTESVVRSLTYIIQLLVMAGRRLNLEVYTTPQKKLWCLKQITHNFHYECMQRHL